jgi:hypothetical protein
MDGLKCIEMVMEGMKMQASPVIAGYDESTYQYLSQNNF